MTLRYREPIAAVVVNLEDVPIARLLKARE